MPIMEQVKHDFQQSLKRKANNLKAKIETPYISMHLPKIYFGGIMIWMEIVRGILTSILRLNFWWFGRFFNWWQNKTNTKTIFDFNFRTNIEESKVVFSKEIIVDGNSITLPNIKISRGEERIFIWCFLLQ